MKRVIISTVALLSCLALWSPAFAETELHQHSVVTDTNGRTVHAYLNGTCVRTKWNVGFDSCAATPVATQQPAAIRTVLTSDERNVYFAFDKAQLTPEAQAKLNDVSQRLLKADDVASAEIVGYADRKGTTAYNDRLSARRAEAVKNYLVQHGYLNVNVTKVRAMGEANPTTHCPPDGVRSTEIACLAPDRRVNIQLVYKNKSVGASP